MALEIELLTKSPMKNPYRIVYLDRDGLPPHIKVPAPNSHHEWRNYPTSTQEQAIERSQHADILVINKAPITAQLLDACPSVKHVVVSATGYNVVDIAACQERSVSVSNIPSYAATTVSEHVIACAMTLHRELFRHVQSVNQGKWQTSPTFCLFGKPFKNLEGATMGLIGLGEIGEATARKAHALGMNVVFCKRQTTTHPFAKQVELVELLQCSDIVSLHCDLNSSTANLIGEEELALMPEHAILINTARGGIVDEVALCNAIKKQRLAGIAFDVLSEEPPRDDSPLLSISNLPNVLITPHIAWASEQAMQYLANTVSRNIDAFINGSPINIVS